ncbi:hypothetical protein LINGRAHAP2_LOCUS11185 [Linum grandiflorum]
MQSTTFVSSSNHQSKSTLTLLNVC